MEHQPVETVASLNTDLEGAGTTIQEQQDSIAGLEAANTTLQTGLDDALEAVDEWTAALADKEEELAAASAQLASTAEALEQKQAEHAALTEEYSAATSALAAAREQLLDLRIVANLEERVEELRAEIDELLRMRQPLIPSPGDVKRVTLACTGSMEPALTCIDAATWLENSFFPEDIVVGAVISYWSEGCGWEAGGIISHRVMAIEERDGVLHFWPKGDNNPEPDGCWVAESYVDRLHDRDSQGGPSRRTRSCGTPSTVRRRPCEPRGQKHVFNQGDLQRFASRGEI